MANFKGSDKLVNSSYFYNQLKNFDIRREEKLHNSLFKKVAEIPAHYELAETQDASTPNSKIIVIDGTLTNSDTEVELATVQGSILAEDVHVYVVGEYVVYVDVVPESEKEIYLKASNLVKEDTDLDFSTF